MFFNINSFISRNSRRGNNYRRARLSENTEATSTNPNSNTIGSGSGSGSGTAAVETVLTNEGTRLIDAQSESQNYDTATNITLPGLLNMNSTQTQDDQNQTTENQNNDNTDNDTNINININNTNEGIQENQDDDDIGDQITTLTNRLRILFYTLYIPIIPLSGLLFVLLIQLIMNTITSPPCSYPLRFFAILSLLLFIYTPNHKAIKRYLFNYSRERDGMIRPRSVRIYDQCFHTICLLYIYLDMVLIQSCREDLVNDVSTCTTTCPDLYAWFQRFDLVLRIFAGILILPLVCLPFVYMWIMRRIHTTEALFRFERGLGGGGGGRREEDNLAGGVLVKEVMEGLREVVLVKVDVGNRSMIKIVGKGNLESWSCGRLRERDAVKDCCICMSDFYCEGDGKSLDNDKDHDNDGNSCGNGEVGESVSNCGINGSESLSSQGCIVETKCGHLFHKACIGGWIGGRYWEDASSGSNTRARRKCCPLCREDLTLNGSDQA